MGTQPGRSAGAQDYTAPVRRTTRLADDRTKSPPRSGWAAAGTGQRGGLKGSELKGRPDVPERAREIVGSGVIAIQRARVADRRIRAKEIVHTRFDLEPRDVERIRPPDLHVVIERSEEHTSELQSP